MIIILSAGYLKDTSRQVTGMHTFHSLHGDDQLDNLATPVGMFLMISSLHHDPPVEDIIEQH